MRVLEQILLWWAVLSVAAGFLIARAWEASERQLEPIRIHRKTRSAEAHHTAV